MQDAKWHKFLVGLTLLLLGNVVWSQAVVATLTSKQSRVQIGRPFEVELGVRHPERTVVVFPDSTKDFKPYEVKSGKSIIRLGIQAASPFLKALTKALVRLQTAPE